LVEAVMSMLEMDKCVGFGFDMEYSKLLVHWDSLLGGKLKLAAVEVE
jgi:hypothetical protein